MLLREVEYARPRTVEEAVEILAQHDGARALAGGQTLINVMKARAASPDVLVDLAGLGDLREIRVGANGALEVGAMVTYAQVITSSEVGSTRPVLAEIAASIADVQVRNRGTIGGNVCSSDPTNHFLPLMVAAGATMTVVGRGGERQVPAEDFFLGVYFTAVGPGELLTRITLPPARGDGFAAVTIGKDGTCIANAAATLHDDGPRVAVGCVGPTPVRAHELEARLRAGDTSEASVRAAARGLGPALDPPSDVHASADYRRHLAEVLAARAVLQAVRRATA